MTINMVRLACGGDVEQAGWLRGAASVHQLLAVL